MYLGEEMSVNKWNVPKLQFGFGYLGNMKKMSQIYA